MTTNRTDYDVSTALLVRDLRRLPASIRNAEARGDLATAKYLRGRLYRARGIAWRLGLIERPTTDWVSRALTR